MLDTENINKLTDWQTDQTSQLIFSLSGQSVERLRWKLSGQAQITERHNVDRPKKRGVEKDDVHTQAGLPVVSNL